MFAKKMSSKRNLSLSSSSDENEDFLVGKRKVRESDHPFVVLTTAQPFAACGVAPITVTTLADGRHSIGNLDLEGSFPVSFATREPFKPATPLEATHPIYQHLRALEAYQDTRHAIFVDWYTAKIKPGPNGEMAHNIIMSTRFGNVQQLHHLHHAMGARNQLTFFREPITSAWCCPVGKTILFQRDEGGNEKHQIYLMETGTTRLELLTDGKNSQNTDVVWNTNGTEFAFASTMRNGSDTEVIRQKFDPTTGRINGKFSVAMSIPQRGRWQPLHYSINDTLLLARNYISVNDVRVYVAVVANGKRYPLIEENTTSGCINAVVHANFVGQYCDRDGNFKVYFTSDEGSEFCRLYSILVSSKGKPIPDTKKLITSDLEWDISQLSVATYTNMAAFALNKDGYSKLYIMNSETDEYTRIEIPIGVLGPIKIHNTRGEIAFSISTPQSPSDVYVASIQCPGIRKVSPLITQWTKSEVGGLDSSTFTIPKLIRYPISNIVSRESSREQCMVGHQIPCFFYKPPQPSGHVEASSSRHPVIVCIQSGPESQSRPHFNSLIQFLIKQLNMAVLLPNLRGSSGYGKTYLTLDDEQKRDESIKDIGALLDWIDTQPDLDSSKVFLWGGSYGEHLVLAAMNRFSHRLRAGLEIVEIANFLERSQKYQKDLRRLVYANEQIPERRGFLESITPTMLAHGIRKPMLIAQGLHDPHVPVANSEQIVQQIRANGVDMWYVLAKDEGHGFRKKENVDFYQRSIVAFLVKHME